MVIFFLIIVLIAIAELIVSGTWQPFYFTWGIPIYWKSVRLSAPPELSIDILNNQFSQDEYIPFLFKRINRHEIAFREVFFSLQRINYTPIMHGLIRYDDKIKELKIIGLVNWFSPLFIMFLISISISWSIFVPIIGIMLIVLFTGFFIQYRRFSGICKALPLQNADCVGL